MVDRGTGLLTHFECVNNPVPLSTPLRSAGYGMVIIGMGNNLAVL